VCNAGFDGVNCDACAAGFSGYPNCVQPTDEETPDETSDETDSETTENNAETDPSGDAKKTSGGGCTASGNTSFAELGFVLSLALLVRLRRRGVGAH